MSFKDKKPVIKNYHRKPYITTGEHNGDYLELFEAIPRAAIEDQVKLPRSAFDKPYKSSDYPAQEYEWPDFPGINFNDISFPTKKPVPDVIGPDADMPVPGIPCAIRILPPLYCCCKSGGEFDSSLQGFDETNYTCWAAAGFHIIPTGNYAFPDGTGGDIIEQWCNSMRVRVNGVKAFTKYIAGGPYPLKILPPADDNGVYMFHQGDRIDIWVEGKDKNGNPVILCARSRTIGCSQEAACEFDCCTELPDGAFAFDDGSTPDTIVANNHIEVYVTGGCGPFTFATSSTGYDFEGSASYQTSARNATLNCASGSCGSEYHQYCSFTITDDCGTEVGGVVLNTAGYWYDCVSEAAGCSVNGGEVYEYQEVSGYYFRIRHRCCITGGNTYPKTLNSANCVSVTTAGSVCSGSNWRELLLSRWDCLP